ncbi:hypothetical protein N7471_001229 [Penicillium samsonianum]|uniref:uncharacterized protein n=1 Tax=Penicillium samsonianum TaxID=1882272 RepID=UPI0025494AF6|nr:uncharacterized protein N7471_001229 [Penicillium samsonianum]KAJ6150030.1 hypothetical protein N7471_001229 [Penicillium samsonianum]
MVPNNERIQLIRMSQQAAIRKPEDDWTGMRQQTQSTEDKAQLHSNKAIVVPPSSTPILIDRDETGFTCTIAPPMRTQ